jgi:hypothetical protein
MRYYLRKVRLDSQGYDNIGSYFGIGQPLYYYVSYDFPEGLLRYQYSGYIRASSRQKAKEEVLKINPKATFWN